MKKKYSTVENDLKNLVESYPRLSSQGERSLFQKIKEGDSKAREKLVLSNLRSVFYVSRNMAGNFFKYSPSKKWQLMEDLFQEGFIGLEIAVDKFNLERNFRFNTYSEYWIRKAIQESLRKYQSGITPPFIDLFRFKLLSLNFAYDDKSPLESVIEDKKSVSCLDVLCEKELSCNIDRALKKLKKREEVTIRRRYFNKDLEDYEKDLSEKQEELTFEQVGKELGVTRQRVEQIEKRALKKLRCASLKLNQ